MTSASISPNFPYEPHYVEVHGSKMHYVDEGAGGPILFLHGNPASSYLWRNVIPHLSDQGRCIAPDLIGMGKSDKPDIAYRFNDHYKYISGFIDALDLKNIILVIHDWGSALGFHYAMQNEDNVKGIAFMEAIMYPVTWSMFPLPFKILFKLFRTKGIGELINGRLNFFAKQMTQRTILRRLTDVEKAHYAAPYPNYASRKPTWQWPREIPIEGHPADNHAIIESYWQKLQQSPLPKLMITAKPGALITQKMADMLQQKLPNLTTEHIGAGMHFIHEDNPHGIGEAISKWLATLD